MARPRLIDALRKRPRGLPVPETLEDLLLLWARAITDFARDNGLKLIRQGDALLAELIAATDQSRHILRRFYKSVEHRLHPDEVRFLEGLSQQKWREIIELTLSYVQTYIWPRTGLSRTGAINALKGFVNELFFYATRTYRDEVADATFRAEELARRLDIPDASAVIRRFDDVTARTVDGTTGKVVREAIGDGVLGFEHDGVLYLVTVLEMKSPSNRRHLLEGPLSTRDRLEAARQGVFGVLQKREGQISRDIERLENAELFVDGVRRPDGSIKVFPEIMQFVGVMPQGQKLTDDEVDAIRAIYRNFRQVEQEISDQTIRAFAKELLRILSGK